MKKGLLVFGGIVLVLTIFATMMVVGGGFRLLGMNINREVRQHSQQYTETKTALLRNLHSNYQDLEMQLIEASPQLAKALRAQQAGTVRRMKEQADLIPSSQVPADIAAFLRVHQ